MQIIILQDQEQITELASDFIVELLDNKPSAVLGLATGSTPLDLYSKLAELNQQQRISFKNVTTFNLDEYLGIPADHSLSYRCFMNTHLFKHIDIPYENTHLPNSMTDNPKQESIDYDRLISETGGIDLQLLGIGVNGHIGFNEPSSSLASRTRVKTLTQSTLQANSRFFSAGETQPRLAITMGIGTIMEAKQILLLAYGEDKADAIKASIEGPITAMCPASILQMHPEVTFILDETAARKLDNINYYKQVYEENKRLLRGK